MSLGDDGYGRHSGGAGGGYGDEQQLTRTRLPEGETDPYGPGRRAGRRTAGKPSRNLVTVVGVVVLLLAAIAFANRGGGDSGSDGAGKGDGTSADSRPTAPSGTTPVEGRTGGVPSGYAHTEQGAQSAAANYAVALGGDGMYRTDTRRALVSALYAPEVVAARQGDFDKVYSDPGFLKKVGLDAGGNAPRGTTFVSRTNPVGTKSLGYAGSTASVAVWYSTLFGLAGEGSTNPVTESWYTDTFDLQWTGDDWKIVGLKRAEGPAPVGRDQAAASAKDMSDAVQGFGGFTYAR
ncbi:hypothetical protein ACFP1Z_21045 [Streptomyces gamaensis]|uniref:Integral membrane protein n=1 Tax=Streptomyces gamaensis TaxID=1763542 RepID=A0ABW0Z1E0_9ACTN